MISTTVEEIIKVTGGTLLQGDLGHRVTGVCTDSRKVQMGDAFVALQGRQVDGHDFVSQVLEQGVNTCLVSREMNNLPTEASVILVQDTLQAVQQLAAYNRTRLNIPIIAVTGSNGKTSTKDMLAAVLSTRYNTLKTEGNFNNELGLPLTLLRLNEQHQAAVVEMGMRGLGEIDFLAQLAKPTGAVITVIGESHLELLGTVENIARAKAEVLDYIDEQGFAILNGDSPYLREQSSRCHGRVWFYSLEGSGDIVAKDIQPAGAGVRFVVTFPGGQGEVLLPVPGRHNVLNSLAVVGVGLRLGLTFEEIARGLSGVVLSGMRLEIIKAGNVTVINDAYNANPSSAKAAIKVLEEYAQARKLAVLGNMYELGKLSEEGHRQVGEAAARAGVDFLLTVGDLAGLIDTGANMSGLSESNIRHFEDNQGAISFLKGILQPGDTILVKGSRGMHMEEVVKALVEI